MTDAFDEAMAACPLVAILRGVRPDEVEAVGDALVDAGFRLLEVPLNSPDPFASIERLQRRFGDRALVGAGTVLEPEAVDRVAATGARLLVSPDANPPVIARAAALGLFALPGVSTPTEAFAALRAGARALKLFPAEGTSPAVLRALRAVLPPATAVLPVGGVEPETMAPWLEAGAAGFGIGGALYKPGRSAADVGARARAFVAALPPRLSARQSPPAPASS